MNQKILGFCQTLWTRTLFLRSPVGMPILCVLLLGLRLIWINLPPPALRDETISAYGSIRTFYGPAQFNHDGSQFIFIATATDRGRTLFLADTLTGKKRPIIEDRQGMGYFKDEYNIKAGPWSPDDSGFLCDVSNQLMVLPADPNQHEAVIGTNTFSEAVWLAPTKFAFVSGERNLFVAQKSGNGQWNCKHFLSEDVPLTSLTVINSNAVAWLENSAVICHANLSEPKQDRGETLPLSAGLPAQPSSALPTNGLTLWLDASKLKRPDKDLVRNVPDLSSKGNDFVWNKNPPSYNAKNSPGALNGKSTIHFGYLNSQTNGTGLKTRNRFNLIGAAARSVFAVMRHDENRAMMISMGDTRTNGTLFAVEGERDRFYLPGGWYADNRITMTSTNWNILEVVYDGTMQRGYIDGVLRGVTSVKLNTSEKEVEIGYRTATSGRNPKTAEGDFAELLVYNKALSNAERKQVEDYLNLKWFAKMPGAPSSSMVWYDSGLSGLTSMAYSQATGMLLLGRSEDGNDSVWQLDTVSSSNASPTLVMEGTSVRSPQWAGSHRFVYSSQLDNRASITVADASGGEKKTLLQLWASGDFDWFKVSPDQNQVFLFGNISNTPVAGIWRNSFASDRWNEVISASDYPSTKIQPVTTSRHTLFTVGGKVTYIAYQPANYNNHKKHPLVLGDTIFDDPLYRELYRKTLAACGASVAIVERRNWNYQLDQWATNVLALYESLASDPSVDTSRVYLFGTSAETKYVSELAQTKPALWRGVILCNPGVLPDFSKLPNYQPRPKIFIDAGGNEHKDDLLKDYQGSTLFNGALVEFYTYPGENHQIVSIDAKIERTKHMMHFVFEE